MKKSLFTLSLFLITFCFAHSVIAQEFVINEKITEGHDQKKELKNLTLTTETVLDSIVYYSYDLEGDSVRLLKKIYDIDESGVFETRYEFVWVDDQWIYSIKQEITLNDSEQLVLSEYFNWDTSLSEWINDKKTTITYDENGYDDLYTSLRWNVELDRWDNYYKDDSDYDANGNLELYIEWLGNEQNEWEYSYKEVNTYNTDNSLNDSYIAFWNADVEEWENYHKEEFYYYESGLTNYRLYYIWTMGDWGLRLKTDYTYTGTEQYESLTTYQRVEDEWVLFAQRNFTYDDRDNPILVKDLKWINEAWENDQKTEFEYDQNNYRTFYLFSVWDENSETWVYQLKYDDLYDEMGNRLMTMGAQWSVDEMEWIGIYFNEYFYNDDFKRLIEIYYEWDEANGDWYLDEKGFYYRSIVLQSPELIAHSISVYPNPVKNILTIKSIDGEYANCVIVSLTGQQIEQFKLQGNETQINLEDYPVGIYFLRLKVGNEIISKKIIKQ